MMVKLLLSIGAGIVAKMTIDRARTPAPGVFSGQGFSPDGSNDAENKGDRISQPPGAAGRGEAGAMADEPNAEPEAATGHVPADLSGATHPDGTERADEHFRPDPTAPVDPADRESLRPATMPAPHDPPGS